MIKFSCPHCGKEVSAGDENAGKKGRCPGCKELFVIPAGASRRPVPAPAAERRTPPTGDDAAPPRKRVAVDGDNDDTIAEAPRKKRPARDDDEDEAIAEAPRKRRPARDDDEEDDDRPSRRRDRDEEEDDDRPRRKRDRDTDDEDDDRPRKKRSRDDEDDDRPRKKRKKRKGDFADCPSCGCRGHATKVGFTWWGGILGARLLSHVRCNRCGTCYNGKTGNYNTVGIAIYVGVAALLGLILAIVGVLAATHQ